MTVSVVSKPWSTPTPGSVHRARSCRSPQPIPVEATANTPTRSTRPVTHQFDDGCMTGQNTVVVYYGADNVNWDSTRSSQCGLDHRSWDMANHMTLTTTNAFGETTAVTNPAGDTTTYTYNLRHQLETVTDPVGNTTTYTYNKWNNQATSLDDPDLGTVDYTYDLFGRLETQTDARGVTLDVGWDDANRPLNIKYVTGSTWEFVPRWTYDPAGHAGQVATTEHWNRRLDSGSDGLVKQTHTYNNRHQIASDHLADPRTGRHHPNDRLHLPGLRSGRHDHLPRLDRHRLRLQPARRTHPGDRGWGQRGPPNRLRRCRTARHHPTGHRQHRERPGNHPNL